MHQTIDRVLQPAAVRARSTLGAALRRGVSWIAAALLLASPAAATWSIVVVNTRTGEVGLFSATCVRNINLERLLGMIRVGEGAAAIQFAGDPTTAKRRFIWQAMSQGDPPAQILADMQVMFPDMAGIQLGIASKDGPAATWTGTSVWDPNFGVSGQSGDLLYAIQGNVITGSPVVLEAEAALLQTEGDMVTRLLAAMEASRAMGGDGRCSCNMSNPGACGAPPPSFTKTADVGFIVVARMGDTNGVCASGLGCTNGDYYLQRRVTMGNATAQDPVLKLFDKVRLWQQGLVGVADQLRTEVTSDRQVLVADGRSRARVTVRLVDRDGLPLTVGGQSLTVTPAHAGGAPATLIAQTDNGDGTHTFDLEATMSPGAGTWELRVNDGTHDVLLWPPFTLETEPLVDLHSSAIEVSATLGAEVVLTVQRPAQPNASYRVLGSLAGTSPGTTLNGVAVPLNPDRLFGLTLGQTRGQVFTNFAGTLDATGRAEARFTLDPSLATVFIGSRFDFAALTLPTGGSVSVTSTDGFDVVP